LADCPNLGEGFGDVLLESAELVVLEDDGEAVFDEDHSFEERLYIQLLQHFLLALAEEAHLRPLQIPPERPHQSVEVILEKLTEVHLRPHCSDPTLSAFAFSFTFSFAFLFVWRCFGCPLFAAFLVRGGLEEFVGN
jgi:hypothetical protein